MPSRAISRSGSAARRWRTRSSTCSPAPPSPRAGCRPRSRCDSSTTRRSATSPARTARSATARVCSSATAGTTRASCPTRFPFGHGLSYTTFAIGAPRPSTIELDDRRRRPTVERRRSRTRARGAAPRSCSATSRRRAAPRLTRPLKELKAFAKVWLDPGETTTVTLDARPRARLRLLGPRRPARRRAPPSVPRGSRHSAADRPVAQPRDAGWDVEPGVYELHVGRSAADITHVVPVTVLAPSPNEAAT